MKGQQHEIHRDSDETKRERNDTTTDQTLPLSEEERLEKLRKWYALLIPQVEEEFNEKGKLEEWYAKLWVMSVGGEKDKFYFIPILASQEKLSGQLEAVKRYSGTVKADGAAAVFKRIHMEHDEEAEFDVKNQESIELLFEGFGFCSRHVWDIARVSGKLPWLINGREDKLYSGGNLLDFINLG